MSSSLSKPTKGSPSFIGRFAKFASFAAIVVPVFYLLIQHLGEMDKTQIAEALRAIPAQSIAWAGVFTAISLYGVARYDLLAIRQLGYKVPERLAVKGGFVAVSLGQSLGFGLVVGAFSRWRFYRAYGVGLKESGLISALVAGGFLLGFAMILSATVLIDPTGIVTMTGVALAKVNAIAFAGLLGSVAVIMLSASQLHLRVGRFKLRAPKLKVLKSQVILAGVDVIPAAIALWVLIPADVAPSVFLVIPVYLTALGVGLVSNTPGGLGVLELACLVALPVLPPEQLIASLIAYRAIYFGVPAVIAAAMLASRELRRGEPARVAVAPHEPEGIPSAVMSALARSERADAALAYLGDKSFIVSDCGRGFMMYGTAGNSMIALSDPVGPKEVWARLIAKFEARAAEQMHYPSFYKVGAEFAAYLAKRGAMATHLSTEAVVDVAEFSTSGSSKRELRRKLKGAEKAGVSFVIHDAGAAPMGQFAQVNAAWALAKGGERGFSMGFFNRNFLKDFKFVEARNDGVCVGFLSLWSSGDGVEWGLDVMRLLDAAPDGTMHAMVVQGIEVARTAGAQRFAIGAVPLAGIDTPDNLIERALAYVYAKKPRWHGSAGLYRFKNAFRPNWEPRYGVAPGLLSSMMAARDVAMLIHGPDVEATGAVETAPEFELVAA